MLKVIFVTSNKGKVQTMKKWVDSSDIRVYRYRGKIDLPERQLPSIEEIAKYKAFEFRQRIKTPFVVQDSGFYLDAFPGFPGPNIKYVLSTIGIEGILKIIPNHIRDCYFEDVLAFWSPNFEKPDDIKLFTGRVYGRLALAPSEMRRSGAWSDLWRVFIPDGFSTTLAAMDDETQGRFAQVRNQVSMNCFLAFANWINVNKQLLYVQEHLFDGIISEEREERDKTTYSQSSLFEFF